MTPEEQKLFLEASKPMHDAYVEMLRGMYVGIDDWDYHCLPWMTTEYWEQLINIIGLDNIRIPVFTKIPSEEHGTLLHPTVFISPVGKANIKEFNND